MLGNTSKYTLLSAIAFVAITGGKKGLQGSTRLALHDFTEVNESIEPGSPLYILNDAGRELLEQSRLWKAHKHLTTMGFKVRQRRPTPRHISYELHDDNGERWAFTGNHGRVYMATEINPRTGRWSFKTELVTEFKNGEDK